MIYVLMWIYIFDFVLNLLIMDNLFPNKDRSHGHTAGYYYQPLIPVVHTANPAQTTAPRIPIHNTVVNRQFQHQFRKDVRGGDTDEHRAFVEFYDGVRKLNLFTDFWTNFCFCCDYYWRTKENTDRIATDKYNMKHANTLRERIDARARYVLDRESTSQSILSSDMTYTIFRWTFQIGVAASYFTIFAMLLVYYQDAFFCDQFKDNLKPNITSTDKFAQKCDVLTKKECIISLNFAMYNMGSKYIISCLSDSTLRASANIPSI
jgi:hypothetical protein